MSLNAELLEGALLITDAHYSHRRPKLLGLLQAIDSGAIHTTQLILLGDIFDLLFAPIPFTCRRNIEVIDLINAISHKIPVIYFEGNHDFQIAPLFPKVYVVPIAAQPLRMRFKEKNILMAHGDYGSSWQYRTYTKLIRSRMILRFLALIDSMTHNGIIRRLDRYLEHKDDCAEIEGFKDYITKRMHTQNLEEIDTVIEGHFHQNKAFELEQAHYFNPAAFACNERYYVVKSMSYALELKEFTYH